MTRRNDHGRITGRQGVKLRLERLAREPLCRHCMAKGIVTLAVTPDHITPLYKGGTDTEGNIQCLCEEHHRDKTNRDAGAKVKRRYSEDGWPVDDDGRGAG